LQKNTIEIALIASKKTGVLPALMNNLSNCGLLYRRCSTTEFNDDFKLTVICEGTLYIEESDLIQLIESIPFVEKVISFDQDSSFRSMVAISDASDRLQQRINELTMLHPLRADDAITHDVLQIVEDRLSLVFGPVANLLVKSAAKKSTVVGELFLFLAEELNDEQKEVFLANVKGLDVAEYFSAS